MKNKILASILAVAALTASCSTSKAEQPTATVKDHFKDDFLIGAAIPVRHVNGEDPKADSIVSLHFNSIVAENCMKNGEIQPKEGQFKWEDADKFVKYGEDRNMAIIGHALIWHSQLAPWFPKDSAGNDVSPEVLKQRMKDHIYTVVGRYKGRIKGWDVVNEAIEDDGSYRKSPFYRILGEEYIPLAFQYAHEADPDAELYINDFSMFKPEKREAYVKIVNDLKQRGLRIDGIGMQSHIGMDYPEMDEYEKSIVDFAGTGCNVMITELDMSALPTVQMSADVGSIFRMSPEERKEAMKKFNVYPDGLPEEVSKEWNDRMAQVFALYKKHADKISRVTFWGTHDGMSWKNGFPIPGRTDYPLLFDRQYNMKPFMQEIIEK